MLQAVRDHVKFLTLNILHENCQSQRHNFYNIYIYNIDMVNVKQKTRKVSKRVAAMLNDPASVWGKNLELEHFWSDLASGTKVVLIYKNKTHKYVNLPNRTTKKYQTIFDDFEDDNNVVAILTSNPSQDAYEQYLYPKAKSKSVDYVIKHYTTYFKPSVPGGKLRVP